MEHVFSKTARYYDKLYAKKDYAGEVEKLISLLGLHAGTDQMTLLDVACGTGLHLEHFAGHFRVEGLDICRELLEIARERNPGIRLHLGDMTGFALGKQFNIVTCLFSSIGYAKTLGKLSDAVRSMTAHLKPQGVLAVEPWFTPENWHPNTVHGMYIDEPDLKLARISTSFVKGNLSVFDLHHLVGTPEGTRYLAEHHELGLFEVGDMISAMEDVGLTVRYDPDGLTGRGLYIGKKNG